MRSHKIGLIFFQVFFFSLRNNVLLVVHLYFDGREKAAALPVPGSEQTLLNLP